MSEELRKEISDFADRCFSDGGPLSKFSLDFDELCKLESDIEDDAS